MFGVLNLIFSSIEWKFVGYHLIKKWEKVEFDNKKIVLLLSLRLMKLGGILGGIHVINWTLVMIPYGIAKAKALLIGIT